MKIPDYSDIEAAARRIAPFAHRTPVMNSAWFNHLTGAEVFFKCENFQRVGAFKFRGACNAIAALTSEQGRRGIVTHSSGNHGQAVALAARLHSYPATIVMPDNSARVKIAAVREYGAQVSLCRPGMASREAAVEEICRNSGALFIPPYDDPLVVAGQGTAARELLEAHPDLDFILVPVGGGGLLGGTAIAARHLAPKIRVIATEPKHADDAWRSFRSGRIEPAASTETVADGLRATLGRLNFAIMQQLVDEVITVEEPAIVSAMRAVWERMKIIIEPSCAVPVAALTEGLIEVAGRRIGVILTGGNVDLDHLPWMR